MMDRSDDDLLTATPADPDAFAAFYQRYERDVLAFFQRRTRNPELAADLAAETFAGALLGAARFRPGGAPAAAWLFGIARHKLQRSVERGRVEDEARRRLAMEPLVLEDEALAVIEALGDDARAVTLLDGLPGDHSTAVRGRVIDELEYADLAARLRCSEAVVRQRVSRGLASLRRQMGTRP